VVLIQYRVSDTVWLISTTASTWGKPQGRRLPLIIGMRVMVCRRVFHIQTIKDRTGINPMRRLNAQLSEKSPLLVVLFGDQFPINNMADVKK
jgi:hypothetical protein